MPQMKTLSPGIRYRDPQFIKDEISCLQKEYGIRCINTIDEIAIPLNPKKAEAHLNANAQTRIVSRAQLKVD